METGLTVAVTGPTGTFGFGLLPRLQSDDRIERVVGIARRSFDPLEHGWTKLEYRRGDVRDPAALEDAFAGADVVVHLAFMITGTAARQTIRAINVDGTLNAFRAAAAAGARRFVYASSVAAYGFHADNPQPLTEDWPVRPASHLFYAQEKAEIEHELAARVGPPSGARAVPAAPADRARPARRRRQGAAARSARAAGARRRRGVRRLPVPVPVLVPALPLQFVHEDDVGQALLLSIVGAGPPGAYNIAGDGVLTATDVARELGLLPLWAPRGIVQTTARAIAGVPYRAAGRRVGGGDRAALDHGLHEGSHRAGLGAALQRSGRSARHVGGRKAMSSSAPQRLSPLDVLFLYGERPETMMHVASLMPFKPPGGHAEGLPARPGRGGAAQPGGPLAVEPQAALPAAGGQPDAVVGRRPGLRPRLPRAALGAGQPGRRA